MLVALGVDRTLAGRAVGTARPVVVSGTLDSMVVTINTMPGAFPRWRCGRKEGSPMELDHMVLADVISPRPDGKLDLHGVGWDTIFAGSVPASHPRMDVAIRFLLSRQEVENAHSVVLALVGEDGEELARINAEVAALTPEQREQIAAGRKIGIGIILTLAGVVFPSYGRYHVSVTWDGTEAREPLRLFVSPIPHA